MRTTYKTFGGGGDSCAGMIPPLQVQTNQRVHKGQFQAGYITATCTAVSADPWREQNQRGAVRYRGGAAQGETAVAHLRWEKRHCESVLHCPGEGRDVVAHKRPTCPILG